MIWGREIGIRAYIGVLVGWVALGMVDRLRVQRGVVVVLLCGGEARGSRAVHDIGRKTYEG